MNAELYILRNVDKPVNSEETIRVVAQTLKDNGIRLAYKTELDAKREKIIYGIADSLNPDENIGLIVILNGFENEADGTTIFKTLSSLTATGGTADKKRLEDAICGFTGKFMPATAIGSDGNKNGYIFVVNGMNIVLLPNATIDNAPALIRGAIRDLKALGLGNNKVKNDIVEVLIDQVEVDQLQKKLDNLDKLEKMGKLNKSDKPVMPDEKVSDNIEASDINSENVVDFYTSEAPNSKKPEKLNFQRTYEDRNDPFELIMIPQSEEADNKEEKINNEIPKKEKVKKEKVKKEKPKKEKIEKPKPEPVQEKAEEKEPKQKKKRPTFKERFVPLKEDSGKEKARKIILDLAILVFIVTAGILIKVGIIDSYLNNQIYEGIKTEVATEVEVATEITTDAVGNEVVKKIKTYKDWDKLKKTNSDVIGWVNIKDTAIDYPILQSDKDTLDYQYYLHRDINKNDSGYGSIFADFRSKQGMDSKNIILHGHHMMDGSMFEDLMGYGKYKPDLDYYREHPIVLLDSPKGQYAYKIISVYKTSTLDQHGEFFNYLTGEFVSDAEFMNYVYLVRERSLIDTGVTCNEDDQLVTLSTCSYEYSDFRTVVVARKVRPGESETVDTSKARANPNPLWPDVYYNYDKSAKPKVTTFKTEYKKNKVEWYDGKGNLKGKERMFTLHDGEPEKETPTQMATEVTTEPVTASSVPVQPESIMLNYSQLVMDVGDIETLSVIWTPANTTEKGLKWTSSNVNVVRVASGGKVTAVAPGECTVTAETNNGLSYVTKVIVNDITATRLTLSSSAYTTTNIGETYVLKATFEPLNVTNRVSWSSTNTNVASVSSSGIVRINGYGTCTIKATLDTLTCECVITVRQPATNPPATNPPATNPPATNPPPTNPPATNPPATQPPTAPPTAPPVEEVIPQPTEAFEIEG